MQRISYLSLILLLIFTSTFSQAPMKFNYQGIARNAEGKPLASQNLAIQISLLASAEAVQSDYQELHHVRTNEFGGYAVQIGGGELVFGDMKLIKWESGSTYVRVAIDPNGGNDFKLLGTTQLLSVPYALYAERTSNTKTRSGNVSSGATHSVSDVNYLSKFTGFNTIDKSLLFDNGVNIGLGTTNPSSKFHVFTSVGNQEHVRMENTNPLGWGKFIFYNDNVLNYHTFTKYGSGVGGYYGGNTGFPYANLMVFGSNNSPSVLANGNNIGFALVSGSVANFKFYAHYATGNVGLGGNATPAANIHFNNLNSTGDTLKITNNTSGHLNTDGFDIRLTNLNAEINNLENGNLIFATNNSERVRIDAAGNLGVGTNTPAAKLDVAGQIKISGGNPGIGKVLTSDANGLATWQANTTTGVLMGFVRLQDAFGNGIYTGLSGIVVTLEGTSYTTTTDANGKFIFTALPAGTYSIAVTKTGFGASKMLWVPFTGGSVNSYVGSIKLSQLPTFTVSSIGATSGSTGITVSGALSGSTANKRTVGIFIGSSNTVSSNVNNYIAFDDDNIAIASNTYSFTFTTQYLQGLGIPSGSQVYFIVYPINSDNANSSEYTDLTTGRKVYTAIGSASTVVNAVMP